MRLSPIEQPKSLLLRIAYWYSKHKFGKVLTTLKVLYARKATLLRPYLALQKAQEKTLSLPVPLKLLLKAQIASINGCAFCLDIAHHLANEGRLKEKLACLPAYKNNPVFTPQEQSALAFVTEATKNRVVEEETFAELQKYFIETEIIELTWLNATENFLNLTTLPLGIGSDELCQLSYQNRQAHLK